MQIIVGDVRKVLPTLADESINCVVTSPPYYGLRDYGTAQWNGGDPECDHKQGRNGSGRADGIVDERGQRNRDGVGSMGGDCKRCGAARIDDQIGLERTYREYIDKMVLVFREVRRVLRSDGTLWLNIGDSWANDSKWGGKTGGKHTAALHGDDAIGRRRKETGLKPKDLMMIPHRLAIALQDDGWTVRMDCVWHKPNPTPESCKDRPTKAHEYLFLLSKAERYYYDWEAIMEPVTGNAQARGNGVNPKAMGPNSRMFRDQDPAHQDACHIRHKKNRSFSAAVHGLVDERNKRSVWTVATQPYREAHFATFPEALITPCILAGCTPGGVVLDPFCGAGTTGVVAERYGRDFIGVELNPKYAEMAERRITGVMPLLKDVANA